MMPTFHELQWAVSHNSYNTAQQKTSSGKTFEIQRFYDLGFRGIELDIVQCGNEAEWCVRHGGYFNTAYKTLSSYLSILRDWSGASRASGSPHEPVFVHLDCKDFTVGQSFPEQIDNYLRASLGDQPLLTACSMMRDGLDLMQSGMRFGWSDPGDLHGHLIFVLTGERQPKEVYAATEPRDRICFADLSKSFSVSTARGNRIIANSDYQLMTQPRVFAQWCIEKPAILWRVYVAETVAEFNLMASSGAHMIAADTRVVLPWSGYRRNPLAP